jgi:hypothetical protein
MRHDASDKKDRWQVNPQPPDHADQKSNRQREEQTKRQQREHWRRFNAEKRNTYAPWLLARYAPTDIGLRPLASGTVFWASPDIWVESSDPWGNPIAQEANFVHARIFNLGAATSLPTRVDFYWSDPSVGLSPANMNFIGTEWAEVSSHTARDVRCSTPWVPKFVNDGHECLVINCSNPILDKIQAPFAPTLDRHVAQRNVTVLQGSAGSALLFPFFVNNLLPLNAKLTLTARVEHVAMTAAARAGARPLQVMQQAVAFGPADDNSPRELMSRFRPGTPQFDYARRVMNTRLAENTAATAEALVRSVNEDFAFARSGPRLRAEWTGHSATVAQGGALSHLGQLFTGAESLREPIAVRASAREVILAETNFQPSEQRRCAVEITVPGNAQSDEFVVSHISQWTEGLLTGGCTVVIRIGRSGKYEQS